MLSCPLSDLTPSPPTAGALALYNQKCIEKSEGGEQHQRHRQRQQENPVCHREKEGAQGAEDKKPEQAQGHNGRYQGLRIRSWASSSRELRALAIQDRRGAVSGNWQKGLGRVRGRSRGPLQHHPSHPQRSAQGKVTISAHKVRFLTLTSPPAVCLKLEQVSSP